LLELPKLADVLRRWLARQPAAANVLLVGGGRVADAVREYDRLHGLSESDAHWLAIRAMEFNSRLLASVLTEADWLDSLDGWADCVAPLAILNPYQFMREDENFGHPLPASWQVTSDSIAARAAEHSFACELVLLKSALPPAATTVDAAADAGYVDRMFPEASRTIPLIRCVNLREPTCHEVVWLRPAPEQGSKTK
jgi:hypothetical protein